MSDLLTHIVSCSSCESDIYPYFHVLRSTVGFQLIPDEKDNQLIRAWIRVVI